MAADDILVRLKALLELDSAQANQDVNNFVNSAQQRLNTLRARIEIDQGELEQLRRMLNRTREQVTTQFTIPVAVDQRSLDTFRAQLERFTRQITEAGGVIQKSDFTPVIRTRTLQDGTEQVTEAYRAVITFQTAVGETVQRVVEFDAATGQVNESIGRMSTNFAQQRKEASSLASAIEQYTAKLNALREKSRAIMGGTAETNSFRALIENIDFSHVGNMEELNTMIQRLKQAQAEFDRLNASITNKKLAGTSIEQINQNLEKMPDRIAEIRSRFGDIQIPDNIRQQLAEVEQTLQNIQSIDSPDQLISTYNRLTQILDSVPARLKIIQAEQRQLTQNAIEQQRAQDRLNSLMARYQAAATRYSAFKSDSGLLTEYRALGDTLKQLQQRMEQVRQTGVWDKSITADIASANAQMSQFNNHVVAAGKNSKSLKDTFKEAFSTFGTWLSATSIMMRVIQGFRQAVTAVKDIDAAMTNLKKVTNETDEAYESYLRNVGKQAQQIGSSMSDLIESASTFAKLGYSFKEAQGLAEVATIFANVGDFSNIDTATSGLITAMKAFNIASNDAMSIADKINEVANNYAVSADDLTTGLAHAASALNLAGNSVDQTIAMITAMSEITQNASESGNALKILSMRLRGAKAELEEAGEDTDGMCESTSKLREQILALTGSVDIMADEAGTQFKSTYQIMQEIAAVWNDLTDINQAALLETIAGKMRGNSISALLTNMAQANNVLETSLNSAGSALEEHERWMESIEAHEQQMKAAWQDFSDSLISTDAIKGWYDALTGVLNVLTQIVDTVGSLPTMLGAVAGVLSVKKGWLGTATDSAGNVVGRIGNYVGGSGGFSFGKMINGEVDPTIINQYTEALNNGATAADAMRQAVTDASGQVIHLNGATRVALATQNGAAAAMQQLGISTTATTAKMVAQTVAVKALNAALHIGVMALVSLAASAISKGIEKISKDLDYQANKAKYLKEELEDLQGQYDSTSSEMKTVNDELETTQNRIDELHGAKGLSFVDQEELRRLQETNAELQARKENLEIIAEYQKEQAASKAKETYETTYHGPLTREEQESLGEYKSLDRYKGKTYDPMFGWDITLGEADTKDEYINMLLSVIRQYEGSSKPEQIERVKAARAYLAGVREDLSGYLEIEGLANDTIEEITSRMDQIDSVINPEKYKARKFNEVNSKEDYKAVVETLQELAEGDNLHSGTFNWTKPFFADYLAEMRQYGIELDDIIAEFKASAKEAEEIANTISFSSASKAYNSITDAQTIAAEVFKEQGYSSSITEEQYQKLVSAGQEYADCVENINGYMSLNIDKINQLIQAKYEEQKVTVETGKAQAQAKYAENTKEIQILETELALLGDGYDDVAASIRGQIAALKLENNGLTSEIAGYERLASQLQYATSAYKKWLDAQNAPEAGDAYNNLITAMGQIKEGQENGKIGTAKYKAAVELLVPDGKDVSKYIKTLEKYLTEDASGLQHFIDDMYKEAFLSKNSDGTYTFMDGVTVEDIAKGLGLTDEVTQYMLQGLKDYGWDVSLFDPAFQGADALKQYEEATARVEEAQRRLDALMSDSTATVEEKTAAQKELADAQQQQADAAVAAGLEEEKTAIEKLNEELEQLKEAYASLKELKLTGDIDPNFEVYAKSITDVIAALSGMPDGGYTFQVTNDPQLASAIEQAEQIQQAISTVDALANNGVISYELAATLKDELSLQLTTLEANIDTYNQKKLEEKNADVNVGINDEAFQTGIKNIQDGNYNATVKVGYSYDTTAEELFNELGAKDVFDSLDPNTQALWRAGVNVWRDPINPLSPEEYHQAQLEVAQLLLQQLEAEKNKPTEQNTEVELPPSPPAYLTDPNNRLNGYATTAEKVLAFNDAIVDANGDLNEAIRTMGTDIQQVNEIYSEMGLELGSYIEALMASQEKKESESGQDNQGNKPDAEKDKDKSESATVIRQNAEQSLQDQRDLQAKADETQSKIDALWEQIMPLDVTVDTTEAEDAVDDLAEKTQSAWDELPNDFQKVDAFEQELFNTNDIDQAIANLGTTWDKVRDAYAGMAQDMPWEDQGITPTLNEEEFKKQIEEIYALNYDGPTLGLNADPSKAIATANSTVQEINQKTATITVKGKYAGTSGITLMAKGTRYAKDEDAIVGEAGIETWIHDGQYTTVGHNGAELVHLSRGDQILTAQETKQLFGNKKRSSGNAYASGVLSSLLNTAKTLVAPVATAVSAVITGVKTAISGAGGTSVTSTGTGNTDIDKNKDKKKNTSSGGSSNKKDTSYLDSLDDLVDWIPKAIENLKKKTDEYISYADKAVGYMLKNNNLDAAIKSISQEVDLNLQAYDRYIRQANDIARNLNLSSDVVKKIQDGTIDIQAYDEDTRKAIDAYKKWYELAIDCRDAIEDLKNQQYDLAKQKLDNITQYYENRITLLGTVFDSYQKQIDKKIASGKEVVKNDYTEMISNTKSQVELLAAERDALSKELNALVSAGTMQVGSDDWYSYTDKIKDFDNAILDAQISIEGFKDSAKNIVLTNLQTAMSMLEHVHETIQGLMDLRVAQGKTANAGDYRDLIASSVKQIKNLEAQNAALKEQQMQLDVLSEKYQEIQEQINENEEAILSAKTQQEEWNDAIIDLEIDKLREQNQQYKDQLELMDAIENLEKAKQRRALIYREGQGFNYEAAADDIRSAQQTLDDLLLEQKIQQIEDSKKDNNLYDDFGNELAPIADSLSGLNLSSYYGSILNDGENSSLLASILKNLDIDKLIANGAAAKELSVVIESGAINLSGVNDVNTLADAITNQLPNVLLQQLYKD